MNREAAKMTREAAFEMLIPYLSAEEIDALRHRATSVDVVMGPGAALNFLFDWDVDGWGSSDGIDWSALCGRLPDTWAVSPEEWRMSQV